MRISDWSSDVCSSDLRDLEFTEIGVLKQLGMIERAFDQRLRTGLAVFFEQVFLKTAGVDADPPRTAIGLGGAHHLGHPRGRTDIAAIDPATRSNGISRLQRALLEIGTASCRESGCQYVYMSGGTGT